jgi:hypothetical protein
LKEQALFYYKQLVAIEIPGAITSEDVKRINSLLDKLFQDVIFDLKDAQHRAKTLQSKIEIIIKTHSNIGGNAEDRKSNGLLAVLYYTEDESNPEEDSINLYALKDQIEWEVDLLEGILDSIKFKAGCLISDLGALKLEAQVTS